MSLKKLGRLFRKNLELEEIIKKINILDCDDIKEKLIKFVQCISNYNKEIPSYDGIMIKWLVKAGWDPNNMNTGGLYLIRNAVMKDDIYYFNMLLEFGFNPKSFVGLLQLTCEYNSMIIFERLKSLDMEINERNQNGCTALYSACLVGNYSMVELLLDRGAFINGWHLAGTPLHAACISGNICVVGLLLIRGALIEICNEFGETPLHLACKMGRIDIVKVLIYYNANVNAYNIASHTPLHLAVYNDEIEIAEYLIKKKAHVHSNVSSSPLFISCLQKHPITLLMKMIEAGADVNDKNIKLMTALHAAVYKNYPEAVDLLLKNGADIYTKDLYGMTPVNYAAKLRLTEIIKMIVKASSKKSDNNNNNKLNLSVSKSELSHDFNEDIEMIENFMI